MNKIIDITNTPLGRKIKKDFKRQSGRILSTEDAVQKCLVDQKASKYINKKTLCSFTEAMRAINAARDHK